MLRDVLQREVRVENSRVRVCVRVWVRVRVSECEWV